MSCAVSAAPEDPPGYIPYVREPLRIRIRLPGHPTTGSPVSIWGTFGLPQAIPGLAPTQARSPAPPPTPCLAGHRACACAHARTDRCAQTGHLSCSLIPWVYLCLGVGLLNHTLLPLLVPSGTSIIFSIPALPTPVPTHRGGEFPLLHIFSSTGY